MKAFTFGKFLPFHLGHEAMIRFALVKCDKLTVIVCKEESELITGCLRKKWIEESFINEDKLEVIIFEYCKDELPSTSETSESVSKSWSEVFLHLVPECKRVITSEPYGNYVAQFMRIEHIPFDPDRITVPISGTQIRHKPEENLKHLPFAVKRHYIRKIVIGGTESTGKSTLSAKLAEHYNCRLITEAGRDLIANSNYFTIDDLYKVIEEHSRRIKEAILANCPFIIMDTDIYTTLSYALFVFHEKLNIPQEYLELNEANLYLYLSRDIPFIQDGSRLDENRRNLLDVSHRSTLNSYGVKYILIEGHWEERRLQAIELINRILK